ncbi:hypothetical protein OQJ13_15970 [Legionella sp. PATHC035]|uniref:hypothetical protein n=1 Tax=Legionella sp. PATHC035 TaxID=2992040 RepID=UPI002243CA21|nr:hypothetical protein [Legionella sp. PATHC035]MCW8410477.1 hypothetical protein [Legionella sp. PATHC035]
MKDVELLDIARKACAYARKNIKQSGTTPEVEFYKENAALFKEDMAAKRKKELKDKYPERYKQFENEGNDESKIFSRLEFWDTTVLEKQVAEMRGQAQQLWKAFCAKKGISLKSEHGESVRRHALEYHFLKKEIGNCGEFSRLAFNYIQQNYPEKLDDMNLHVLGVHGNNHVVVSLGSDEDRVICDPSLDLVFKLKDESEKLYDFFYSGGKNKYIRSYSSDPQLITLDPDLIKLDIDSKEGRLPQEEIDEIYQLGKELEQSKDLPVKRVPTVEKKLVQQESFKEICERAINAKYRKPSETSHPNERLIYALQKYIQTRAKEAKVVSDGEVSYDETNTNPHPLAKYKYKIMWWKSQYTAKDKICTAQKVIDILNSPGKDTITEHELEILKDGRLGSDTGQFLSILEELCERQNKLQVKGS